MKKLILSILIGMFIFVNTSTMNCPHEGEKAHPSVIEMFLKIPGFQEYFKAKFSTSDRTSLKDIFNLESKVDPRKIPSIFSIMFCGIDVKTPKIPFEGLPLDFYFSPGFPELKSLDEFAQTFKLAQTGAICGLICECLRENANFNWSMFQDCVLEISKECLDLAKKSSTSDVPETYRFYLLFRSPLEAFNAITRYILSNGGKMVKQYRKMG